MKYDVWHLWQLNCQWQYKFILIHVKLFIPSMTWAIIQYLFIIFHLWYSIQTSTVTRPWLNGLTYYNIRNAVTFFQTNTNLSLFTVCCYRISPMKRFASGAEELAVKRRFKEAGAPSRRGGGALDSFTRNSSLYEKCVVRFF